VRGPFPYYGGKYFLAPKLIDLMPPHKTYVEPFGGAANVLLTKPPSPIEIYNDLNKEVVNFFKVLRERQGELLALLRLTPYSREEFKRCLEPSDDELEQARRTFVKQRMGFSAVQNLSGGQWSYSITRSSGGRSKHVNQYFNGVEHLAEVIERLLNVQIECLPALDIIKRYDTNETFFYCDPPYPVETRLGVSYAHEMSTDDHVALAEALHDVEGNVLVSSYASDLYNNLYEDWWCMEIPTVAFSGHRRDGKQRAERVEVVWANYPIGGNN